MNQDTMRAILAQELEAIAPDVDMSTIDTRADLRDELDIDSMDFLRLTVNLSKRLGVAIPDTEHAQLMTFEAMLRYLVAHAS
jgi:acyl carrier protein